MPRSRLERRGNSSLLAQSAGDATPDGRVGAYGAVTLATAGRRRLLDGRSRDGGGGGGIECCLIEHRAGPGQRRAHSPELQPCGRPDGRTDGCGSWQWVAAAHRRLVSQSRALHRSAARLGRPGVPCCRSYIGTSVRAGRRRRSTEN